MQPEFAAKTPLTDLPIEASPALSDLGLERTSAETLPPVVGMEDFNPEDSHPRPIHRPPLRRILLVVAILVAIAVLIFVPPLVSMNHYRRQIASSIAASLGRPVRIDSVSLNLLPTPGFTLHTFIVGEDPAFGSEPIIRANSVTATLRFSSLWRRRVEFSRISLDAPSVNLVRLADGRWNLESILLQASHVQAAPTAQAKPGEQPRFPYIEATGGRVNLKFGLEKLPISLTDASFALWLPQPNQWQLRIEAVPTRTDSAATDTGTLRVQGSLGRAHRLQDVPVDLTADWDGAPLGGASRFLLGRDEDLRGSLSVHASATGTAGDSAVASDLQVSDLRRADFVPDQTLSIHLHCGAQALALFHEMDQIHCVWPVSEGSNGLDVSGTLPDLTHPASARMHAVFNSISANTLLDALKAASPRVARDLHASGVVFGDVRYGQEKPASPPLGSTLHHRSPVPKPEAAGLPLVGTLGITKATLTEGSAAPFVDTEIAAIVNGAEVTIVPFPVHLGGSSPAMLSGSVDRKGYQLHLAGPVLRTRLAQLARSLPQIGDGLPGVVLKGAAAPAGAKAPEAVEKIELDGTRIWHGGLLWTSEAAAKPLPRGKNAPRRRVSKNAPEAQ